MFYQIFLLSLFTEVFSWYNNPLDRDSFLPGGHDYHGIHNGLEQAEHFLNEWTVQVEGDEEVAQLIAPELGYVYGGPVLGFPNTYTFLKYEHSKQRRTYSDHTRALINDRRIRWAEQLFAKSRVKRYPTPDPDASLERVKRIDSSKAPEDPRAEARSKREIDRPLFNDELWGEEWYLQDTRNVRELPRLDLNVLPVYAMGFTGRGVRVSVLDDGVEHNHTDLRANYDPEISWDCNDGDPDPSPRLEDLGRNSHGTRCAGEIAMTANNVKCGVGVAWGAKVGGVRMLDGRITDRIEGEGISYAWEKVDIYSASWGPNDDGRTVEGPGRLASQALERGVAKATTDTNDSCTLGHTGTSAAAPLAAGIIALALEANSNLTWRDVQHLIVWTSEFIPLAGNPGWQVNDVGLRFDVRFGFGLLDAEALVRRALNWVTVPEKQICHVPPLHFEDSQQFSREQPVKVQFAANNCVVNYVEHVELIVNIRYSRRGALEVYLVSPRGTKVQLLSARPEDTSDAGFSNWPLVSVATWGESPKGIWTAVFLDNTNQKNSGEIGPITLTIHGTSETPAHMEHLPKENTEDSLENTNISDYNNLGAQLEDQNTSETLDEVDPTLLAAVEKELLRIHHRKVNLGPYGL
ncbi:neuroendocrine convertase 1-like isoform X2 [Choristoneura fumiferana]|uniref:neuroendocrine convertase 1-like isoform X2 n=1 Tax=Choristoneura fumiferana TaxID=7141 RepID=UPI003D1555AB